MSEPDYSFMRAGRGNLIDSNELSNIQKESIMSLLALFTSNAVTNATEYSIICKRNGITKEDIRYALIFEVFEFLKNPNLTTDIKNMEEELECMDDEDEEENWEDINDQSNIVPDDEVEVFKRIEINDVDEENKDFVTKMHTYYDNWEEWVPQTPIEKILRDAINKAI
tara:strand:- start:267 stop:770 length:504 start_codon:yes stop_codon:yes gene_type:complete